MKLADRYILSELASPFLLASGGFILFMVANVAFLLVDQIVKNKVPILSIIEMLLLRVPAILVLTFPVAALFATLLGLGRLASDFEIMAMRISGIPFLRLVAPVLGFAVVLIGLTFLTNERIAPWATHQSETIVRQILLHQAIPPLQPNVFLHGPKDTVYYIGALDSSKNMLYHVMIFEPAPDSVYPRMTTADHANYQNGYLHLYQGSTHQYTPAGLTNYETSFQEMQIPIEIDPSTYASPKTPFEMNASELRKEIAVLKKGGTPTQSMDMDYQFKFSLPFASLVACLIGIPLGIKFSHGGKFLNFGIAVTLLFVYYCLFSVFRLLGNVGILFPWLAAWAPNLFLGAAGVWMLFQEEKVR